MNLAISRRGSISLLVAGALLVTALFALPSAANAGTIYACMKKKSGAVRLVSKKTKCKKGEKKIKWSTQGPAGANGTNGVNGTNGKDGTNGTNGTNGVNGQPQKIVKFTASQPSAFSPTPIALFSADGVNYTFSCQFLLFLDDGVLQADGASGQSYALGNFARPIRSDATASDLKSDINVTAVGGTTKTTIASTPTASSSNGHIDQLGVWTVTVEGPNATTWIHASFSTGSTCTIRGSAITVSN